MRRLTLISAACMLAQFALADYHYFDIDAAGAVASAAIVRTNQASQVAEFAAGPGDGRTRIVVLPSEYDPQAQDNGYSQLSAGQRQAGAARWYAMMASRLRVVSPELAAAEAVLVATAKREFPDSVPADARRVTVQHVMGVQAELQQLADEGVTNPGQEAQYQRKLDRLWGAMLRVMLARGWALDILVGAESAQEPTKIER